MFQQARFSLQHVLNYHQIFCTCVYWQSFTYDKDANAVFTYDKDANAVFTYDKDANAV